MTTTVMREAPNVDYYVVWESIVDAPVWGGQRAETLEYLWSRHQGAAREYTMATDPSNPENRLKRADEAGTSTLWKVEGHPVEGSWEDTGFIYQQQGIVSRANVFVLTRRVLANSDADVSDLLQPFDDDLDIGEAL